MFIIKDDKDLSYTLRKIKELQTEHERIKQLAAYEIQRIEEWQAGELDGIRDSINEFNNLVKLFAEEQRLNNPKFKKLSTPYGTVKFKKQQPEWKYNEDEILKTLRENDMRGFIRIKEEVNKEEIKKTVSVNDGEVYDPQTGIKIEGIQVIEREDKLIVEVN